MFQLDTPLVNVVSVGKNSIMVVRLDEKDVEQDVVTRIDSWFRKQLANSIADGMEVIVTTPSVLITMIDREDSPMYPNVPE